MRINMLAKELAKSNPELDSKSLNNDIVKFLQENGSAVTSHSSSLTPEEIELVRSHFGGDAAKSEKPDKKAKGDTTKEPSSDQKQEKPAETKGKGSKAKEDPDKKQDSQDEEDKRKTRTEDKARSEEKSKTDNKTRSEEKPETDVKARSEEKPKTDNKTNTDTEAKNKNPNGKERVRGRLRKKNGGSIVYEVDEKTGGLINVETGDPLPLIMGTDGIIYRQDGTPLEKSGGRNEQPQTAKASQHVSMSFDGRSEKDKRNADAANAKKNKNNDNVGKKNNNNNGGNNKKQKDQKNGALTDGLADRMKLLGLQLDPDNENYVPEVKEKKKKVYDLPEMPKVVKEDLQKNSNADDNAGPDTTAEETNTDNLAVKADERDITVVPERNTTEPAPVKDYTDARSAKTDKNGRGGQNERQNQNERMDRNVSKDQNQENRNRDNVRSFDGRNQDGRGGRSFDGRNQDGRDGRSFDGRNQDGRGGRSFEGRNQDGRDGRSFDGRNQDRRDSQNQGRGQKPFGDRNQGLSTGPRDGGRSFDGRNQGVPDKDSDQRRGFNRKGDNRSSGGSLKSELANELGKDKRAENIKNQNRDKNRKDRNRDYDEDGLKNAKKKDPNRKGAFQKPVAKPQVVEEDIKTITVPEVISIKDLADKMKQNASAIVKKLFMGGKIVNVNSEITFEEAENIALDYDIICEKEVKVNMVEELLKETEEDPDTLVTRPPVVCVMGHVDHGKTSLLDAIRKTNVTAREAGGITQHIGAYMVEISGRKITFLDTPGHEAFTSMRMRGAKSTDIAILVVAADDGVMPQTVEAINHAKAANVSIIVAVNKIDKPGANIERVKQELTEHGLVAEDWGGDTVFVPVSAKTGEGIENLLEMVLLTADVLELKANPDRRARGIVIEAQLDKGRGPVATVLIQKGTLNVGDNVAIGAAHGKVRAMIDDNGRKVKTATPSTPVEILGLNAVPQAGEVILAVADEKEARTIAEAFIAQSKEELIAETKARLSLDGLFSQIQAGEVKELNIIIKADVMGSVEAVKQSLLKLSNEEVVVRVIHGGVGNINESDVTLASASNAIIIGFNVKPDNTAKDIAEHEKIDIKLYKVIYDAINDVEAAMKGMLKPIYEEKVIGHAEIRQLFKASVVGVIAGSYVLDGKIVRGCKARIRRNDELIFEGNLASLKRFKDDVKEVAAGYECGLVFEKFSDLAELDQAEFYVMEEVPRK